MSVISYTSFTPLGVKFEARRKKIASKYLCKKYKILNECLLESLKMRHLLLIEILFVEKFVGLDLESNNFKCTMVNILLIFTI